MGVIKVFWQNQCPRCPQAKEVGNLLKKEGFNVLDYDIETAEGLAEATFYGIQSTPTFILEDPEENTIADFPLVLRAHWRSTPSLETKLLLFPASVSGMSSTDLTSTASLPLVCS